MRWAHPFVLLCNVWPANSILNLLFLYFNCTKTFTINYLLQFPLYKKFDIKLICLNQKRITRFVIAACSKNLIFSKFYGIIVKKIFFYLVLYTAHIPRYPIYKHLPSLLFTHIINLPHRYYKFDFSIKL